jgi:hypothetical protein
VTVLAYLDQFVSRGPVWLAPARYLDAVRELSLAGVEGGSVYDGLIAIAARGGGLRLISLDRRAAATYTKVGVDHVLLL